MYFEAIKMASNRKAVRFRTNLGLIEVQSCSNMGITFHPRLQPVQSGVERDRESGVMVAVSSATFFYSRYKRRKFLIPIFTRSQEIKGHHIQNLK
jgi:hypothetical protein